MSGKIPVCAILALAAFCASTLAEEIEFPKKYELEAYGTHYWVDGPREYSDPGNGERKWPLLVGLHGSGDTGQNFTASWYALRDDGYIVASPKSPGIAWSGSEDKLVLAMIEKLKKDFRVDPKRISVVAFSAGSFFGMPFVFRTPEAFNALVAMGGGGSVGVKPAAKALHVYLIAGDQDGAKSGLESAFESLKKKGLDVTLRIVPNMGHEFPPPAEVDTIRQWFRAFSPEGIKEKELAKALEEAQKDLKAKRLSAAVKKFLEVAGAGVECPPVDEAKTELATLSEEAKKEIEKAAKLADEGKTDAARALLLRVSKDYAGLPEAEEAKKAAGELKDK
jgi:predicted esterase